MSENRSSIRVVVSGFAIIAILALSVAAENSWGGNFFGSIQEFFGMASASNPTSVSDDLVAVSNGPIIFQRGFAAAVDFPFSRGGQLYKVDPSSGTESFFGDGSQPNYSNDGSKIVFLNNANISTTPAASYNRTGLTILGGGSNILGFYPKWAPDGANISYNVSVNASGTLVYHVKIIGGTCSACDITQELNLGGTSSYIYPSWHPTIGTSGTSRTAKLVYVRTSATKADIDQGNYNGDVFSEDITIAQNGTVTEGSRLNLTNSPAEYAFPTYSHDGTKIAYINFATAAGNNTLNIMNAADGSNKTAIVTFPNSGNRYAHHPVWSPDDTRIAFSDSNQIFQVNVGTSQISQVSNTAASANDLFPSWAPGTGNPTPTPTPVSDLELRFNATPPDTVHLNQSATYSLIVNNNGPSRAFGVSVTGTSAFGLLDVGSSSFCNSSGPGGVFTCFLGDIDPGPAHATSGSSVRIMTLQFRSLRTGQYTFSPTVTLDTTRSTDNVLSNNSITATTLFKSDVELLGLEVTQAVQDLSNSVPLVADKKTFIRVHVQTTRLQSGAVMSGNLVGTNSAGVSNGRLSPSNPGGTIKVLEKPQRDQILDSFYFELPPDWIKAGNLQFRFESSDAFLTCEEPDSVPNCAATVNFNNVNPLSMKFVAVTYKDATGGSHTPNLLDAFQAVNEFMGRYPINRIDGDSAAYTTTINPCIGETAFPLLNTELDSLRNTECKTGTCKTYYQALLADQSSPNCRPSDGINGEADNIPGNASTVFISTDDTMPRIHEAGHTLGLKHTDFTGDGKSGQESCSDANNNTIPCTRLEGDGSLSFIKNQYDPNAAYGFDINGSSPTQIYPAKTADFMSYGRPRWVSRATYTQLYNLFKTGGSSPEELMERPNVVTAAQTVLIDGSIQLNGGSGQINSVYISNTTGTAVLPTGGAYALRLENAQGGQIASYSFTPSFGSENQTVGTFSFQLPWDPNTRRIVLLRNGLILASRQASANAPTVHVTSPNGGETLSGSSATFTWTASDQDGDTLAYLLEYSTDNGGTWKPLAVNWKSTSFAVNPTNLAGSNQALFRVTASDGFNTTADQSDAVFTVPAHGPQVVISTPENNHLYVGDQNINLSGGAIDIEDGMLATSRLSWSSNLNGLLGTGSTLSVNASALVEGTHTITLTATDSTNRTGTATVSVRVFRTRPVFPPALSVGSGNLNFTPKTTLQTIPVRNSGDGTLTWTATADQPWIKLSDSTGTDLSNIDVTIIPGGLPFGILTGKITITSPEATNSPQVVNVNLGIIQGSTSNLDGRVVTPDARGLRNSIVTLTDSQGVTRSATTSSFGFFSFTDVAVGETYTVRIGSRLYRFAPRTMQVISDLTLVDFVGLE